VSGLEIRDQISSSSVNELLLDVLLLLRANTATPDFFVSIVKEVVCFRTPHSGSKTGAF
jgi:hypothetical protein